MRKILIVDDDVDLCAEVAAMLSGEGYAVDAAHDAAGGVARARARRYDVILLDFRLPGPGAGETIGRIRAAQPHAKLFIISGKPLLESLMDDRRLAGLVDGTIGKPFSPALLLSKVRSPR
ncbi:MAG: response regulator [bacterium]|nr:response regulator [bacterium]